MGASYPKVFLFLHGLLHSPPKYMWQKIRRWGVEIYAFLTAPFVVKNCLSMLALVAGLFLMTFWWLKCYTHHGSSVEVPVLSDMSVREAQRKARAQDFSVVVSDSVYITGKAPGEVISQNPKAGSRVKEGRTIYLTVTKNNPDILKLPLLANGDDYDLYSRKISRMGLNPRVLARVADPKVSANIILHVLYRGDTITKRIQQGYAVEMGSTIDFIVSEEETSVVNIPDCTCQTYDAAKFLLETSSLSLGTVIRDATVTSPESAYVWRQKPAFDPNGTLRKGEIVDLYLTQEKPKDCANRAIEE
jgi:hypothetical protein